MSKGILMTEEQKQQLIGLVEALGVTIDNNTAAYPRVELTDGILRVEPTYVYDVEELTDEQQAALEALTGFRIKR